MAPSSRWRGYSPSRLPTTGARRAEGAGGAPRRTRDAEVCKLPSERGGGASPGSVEEKKQQQKTNHLKAHPLGKLPRGPGKADREGLWERRKLGLELPQVSRFVKGVGILIALELLRPFPLPEQN